MRNKNFFFLLVAMLIGPLVLGFQPLPGLSARSEAEGYAPECWILRESISVTGPSLSQEPEIAQRISTYEIHEDDTVNPNHTLTGLPYYESLTWMASADVEWLVLEGVYSSYEIDELNHSVTFYDLQDWLHIVYRTHTFIQRLPDQIRFCVIGGNSDPRETRIRVLYPAYYQFVSATPEGYTIPVPGEIDWDFGAVTEFQVDTNFAGLGPDRPLLDFPVDYQGRSEDSSVGFLNAFNQRTTALFDHYYPLYGNDGNSEFRNFTGRTYQLSDCPSGVVGFSCYDGHDGQDIDDLCSGRDQCADPKAVYPAVDGDIVAPTGWNNALGCRITIDHDNGWRTSYGHLQDNQNDHSCSGILIWSGHVTRFDQIGIIGGTGSGGGGEDNAHLHFTVKHNGIVVDPSGWEPNPETDPDPWAGHESGTESFAMWRHAIRTTLALDPALGGELNSPIHDVSINIPPDFYAEPLLFNLSNQPVAGSSALLVSTGHSFSLAAADGAGNSIEQLDKDFSVLIRFGQEDTTDILAETLQIYMWDESQNSWARIPTVIDWENRTATADARQLSVFALMGRLEDLIFLPLIKR